ncbi:hypothetical protein XENOCAPTIV_027132 [Xenoophorus captivus]|uniref:Uncharacterized protein n=1 Tax=Xenoophorus captivus TaxID=1517983 RepID=A0ABV0R6B6_9TELE
MNLERAWERINDNRKNFERWNKANRTCSMDRITGGTNDEERQPESLYTEETMENNIGCSELIRGIWSKCEREQNRETKERSIINTEGTKLQTKWKHILTLILKMN